MKIQQLKCFLAVEKYRSFSMAADSLFMAQSALSKQILSLEDELGAQLFERHSHKVGLTQAGEKIYSHAHWIVDEHEKLLESLNLLLDISSNKITLSVPYDMSHFSIADMIIAFEQTHPEVVAESHENSHEKMIYYMENHRTDFAVGFQDFWPRSKRFTLSPLLQDPLVLVMHKDHPFAERKEILLSAASQELFCLPREDTNFFRLFQGLCNNAGFSPNLTLSDVRISTIKKYISQGMRLTMTSLLRASNYFIEEHFAIVPLAEAPSLTLSLLSRNEYQKKHNTEFIRHAEQYYSELQKTLFSTVRS